MYHERQPLSIENCDIDAHCHLFNGEISGMRWLIDLLKYFFTITKKDGEADEYEIEIRTDVSAFDLSRIINLLEELVNGDDYSMTEKLRKLQPNTILVPLMFDIYHAIKLNYSFLVAILTKLLQWLYSNPNDYFRNNDDRLFLENFIEGTIKALTNQDQEEANAFLKDEFEKQFTQLLNIQKKYGKDNIKPFLAVDPRREDIICWMTKAFIENDFTGVKIYAPNGYSPLDKKLDVIYKFCEKYNIPITAHCSYGGFATPNMLFRIYGGHYEGKNVVEDKSGNGHIVGFKKLIFEEGGIEERALKLNHPALWRRVLEKYPKLKLNLAHMGVRGSNNKDEKYEWSNLIIEMMLKYENLYTDLSCNTDQESIKELWKKAVQADKKCDLGLKVTDRILFGTDFWLTEIFKDMKVYLENFKEVFKGKEDDLKRIKQINPKRFLNIEG